MSVIDFTDTIIAKSDQLNAADIAGVKLLKITDATKAEDQDQPVFIYYEGGGKKPWKPCKSMRRVIANVWGSKVDLKDRVIEVKCDPNVTWAGQEVGGIRITRMSHMSAKKTFPIRVSKNKVEKYTVHPLESSVVASNNLLEEAKKVAQLGVKDYSDWLANLTTEQKEPLREHHESLKKIAKDADNCKKLAEDLVASLADNADKLELTLEEDESNEAISWA